jgi:hypothetical protein
MKPMFLYLCVVTLALVAGCAVPENKFWSDSDSGQWYRTSVAKGW